PPTRHIIDSSMAVRSPPAEVVHGHIQQASLDAPAHDALAKTRFDHRRKDRDDVEPHTAYCLLLVQLEQSLWRVDPNPPSSDIDLDTDIGGKRREAVPPAAFHGQHARAG